MEGGKKCERECLHFQFFTDCGLGVTRNKREKGRVEVERRKPWQESKEEDGEDETG